MKLHYPVPREGNENPKPYVNLNIPFSYRFGLHKTPDKYKNELLEHFSIETGQLLNTIDLLASLLVHSSDYPADTMGEYIKTLSWIGGMLQDASDIIREDFDSENKTVEQEIKTEVKPKADKKKVPNILDLSAETTKEDECIDLAKHLSTVLNHSQLPEKIYRVIHEELGMMDQPSEVFNTAEYIAKVLCNQGGENE